jgi:hypothetical protein
MFKKAIAMLSGILAVASAGVFVMTLFVPTFVAPLAAIVGGPKMLLLISAAGIGIGVFLYGRLGGKLSWRRMTVTTPGGTSPYGTLIQPQSTSVEEVKAVNKITNMQTKQETKNLIQQAKAEKTGTGAQRFFASIGIGRKSLANQQKRINMTRA